MRETRTLEFKETITNTFQNIIFNYDGGTIYFNRYFDKDWRLLM